MISLQTLYDQSRQENITVDRLGLEKREAFSFMDEEGDCFIAIDPDRIADEADERTKLAHEMGHCITGSFYNQWSQFDVRQKHENIADRWGILRLIPIADFDSAVASGCTELWELAEHFGGNEEFMKKAVCLYTHGNLATELYF